MTPERLIAAPPGFSLAETCGPVWWARGRWPNEDWVDGALLWCGHEGERVVWREVRQLPSRELHIQGTADPSHDASWANAVLGLDREPPSVDEPVIGALARSLSGLRMHAAGSLYEGLVSSIVGQSITVKAAAVALNRIARINGTGVERRGRVLSPIPQPATLRAISLPELRATGITMRRAEALHALADASIADALPSRIEALADLDGAIAKLRTLPLVGPWTAASALVWGIGVPDAHPTGDVALLRAAQRAYRNEAMTLRDLDRLAEEWRPYRGWAARWLWSDLLGIPS